jgi:hypothetical protein
MASTTNIGVLLMDKTSGAQIGFIKFDSSGMLVYHVIETGLHVFAFKLIDRVLNAQWIQEPLYKIHAGLLDENKKLPDGILVQSAESCANFLNSLESPLMLGGHDVKAQLVNVTSEDE